METNADLRGILVRSIKEIDLFQKLDLSYITENLNDLMMVFNDKVGEYWDMSQKDEREKIGQVGRVVLSVLTTLIQLERSINIAKKIGG